MSTVITENLHIQVLKKSHSCHQVGLVPVQAGEVHHGGVSQVPGMAGQVELIQAKQYILTWRFIAEHSWSHSQHPHQQDNVVRGVQLPHQQAGGHHA